MISDLLNQQGDFLEWHEFALKFHLNVPFTKYYGLVAAIPKNWKANLENPTPTVEHNNAANILTTRYIYFSLLKSVFVPPTAETKIFRHEFTGNTIQKVYLMPFAITKEMKIIIF